MKKGPQLLVAEVHDLARAKARDRPEVPGFRRANGGRVDLGGVARCVKGGDVPGSFTAVSARAEVGLEGRGQRVGSASGARHDRGVGGPEGAEHGEREGELHGRLLEAESDGQNNGVEIQAPRGDLAAHLVDRASDDPVEVSHLGIDSDRRG